MYDFTIIGGGIVGLSTGVALMERFPQASILLLEKENQWAKHQTGHNSGVIHSGIYYKPGSLKAKFAAKGSQSMIEFCKLHDIQHDICGKIIVATKEEELPLLDNLYQRGLENGLDIQKIDQKELKEIEPHVNGLRGIHVPMMGIVDYKEVCLKYVSLLEKKNHQLRLNTKVKKTEEQKDFVSIQTTQGEIKSRFLINCTGLHSDRVTKKSGMNADVKIIPFRGEYYRLKPEKEYLVKHLIYPVPNPDFPFLGVHFTRMIGGGVEPAFP